MHNISLIKLSFNIFKIFFLQKARDDVPGGGKMPEVHFKVITIIIIVGSMIIGILIPNSKFN